MGRRRTWFPRLSHDLPDGRFWRHYAASCANSPLGRFGFWGVSVLLRRDVRSWRNPFRPRADGRSDHPPHRSCLGRCRGQGRASGRRRGLEVLAEVRQRLSRGSRIERLAPPESLGPESVFLQFVGFTSGNVLHQKTQELAGSRRALKAGAGQDFLELGPNSGGARAGCRAFALWDFHSLYIRTQVTENTTYVR